MMNNAARLQKILDLLHDGTDWREDLNCADVVQELTGIMEGYLTGEEEDDRPGPCPSCGDKWDIDDSDATDPAEHCSIECERRDQQALRSRGEYPATPLTPAEKDAKGDALTRAELPNSRLPFAITFTRNPKRDETVTLTRFYRDQAHADTDAVTLLNREFPEHTLISVKPCADPRG